MAELPAELLTRLKRQAGNRCGYCMTSTLITGQPLTVEHIIPVARGGSSSEQSNKPEGLVTPGLAQMYGAAFDLLVS